MINGNKEEGYLAFQEDACKAALEVEKEENAGKEKEEEIPKEESKELISADFHFAFGWKGK